METTTPAKVALRAQMRGKLAALSAADARAGSAAIWERLSVLPAFAAAKRLLVYVSRESEVDTHGLIRQLLAMDRQVCAPGWDGEQYRVAVLRDFDGELTEGKFGILEPRSVVAPVAPPEVCVAPGLGFDMRGNRLGRGLGHFDRLLRELRGTKIALAYDFQVLGEVPAEPHDVLMDFVVTETRVIQTRGTDHD